MKKEEPESFDREPAVTVSGSWELRLQGDGGANQYESVLRSLQKLCDEEFAGRCHIEVLNSPGIIPNANTGAGSLPDAAGSVSNALKGETRPAPYDFKEADRRKDEFLAILAHELRNPLAPIRNAADLLSSPKLTPQQLRWAQKVIHRQTRHMALLLDDLLDISRIAQGKLLLNKQRVKLTDLVDAAVESARPLIDSKNHSITVSLPADTVLEADPLRLSQVLSNLLTNAAKYTDPAGRIELVGVTEAGTLCLSVRDDGIGIPPDKLDEIFEMFSQGDGQAQRSERGLGIGLALVKGLIELHGGSIEAKSQGIGLGSVFNVRLPLAASASTAVPPTPNEIARPLIARRILIADDNTDAANALATLLEFANHEVRVVHNGRAALALAQTFRPDIALLDIGMPELDGYQVARALRQEPWGANTVLIALTGWGQQDDQRRSKDAGFDRHLTKPIDADELESVLQSPREGTVRELDQN